MSAVQAPSTPTPNEMTTAQQGRAGVSEAGMINRHTVGAGQFERNVRSLSQLRLCTTETTSLLPGRTKTKAQHRPQSHRNRMGRSRVEGSPGTGGVHSTEPGCSACRPASQMLHDVWPVRFCAVPIGLRNHATSMWHHFSARLWKQLAYQGEHLPIPSGLNVPRGQSRHGPTPPTFAPAR